MSWTASDWWGAWFYDFGVWTDPFPGPPRGEVMPPPGSGLTELDYMLIGDDFTDFITNGNTDDYDDGWILYDYNGTFDYSSDTRNPPSNPSPHLVVAYYPDNYDNTVPPTVDPLDLYPIVVPPEPPFTSGWTAKLIDSPEIATAEYPSATNWWMGSGYIGSTLKIVKTSDGNYLAAYPRGYATGGNGYSHWKLRLFDSTGAELDSMVVCGEAHVITTRFFAFNGHLAVCVQASQDSYPSNPVTTRYAAVDVTGGSLTLVGSLTTAPTTSTTASFDQGPSFIDETLGLVIGVRGQILSNPIIKAWHLATGLLAWSYTYPSSEYRSLNAAMVTSGQGRLDFLSSTTDLLTVTLNYDASGVTGTSSTSNAGAFASTNQLTTETINTTSSTDLFGIALGQFGDHSMDVKLTGTIGAPVSNPLVPPYDAYRDSYYNSSYSVLYTPDSWFPPADPDLLWDQGVLYGYYDALNERPSLLAVGLYPRSGPTKAISVDIDGNWARNESGGYLSASFYPETTDLIYGIVVEQPSYSGLSSSTDWQTGLYFMTYETPVPPPSSGHGHWGVLL